MRTAINQQQSGSGLSVIGFLTAIDLSSREKKHAKFFINEQGVVVSISSALWRSDKLQDHVDRAFPKGGMIFLVLEGGCNSSELIVHSVGAVPADAEALVSKLRRVLCVDEMVETPEVLKYQQTDRRRDLE